MTPDGTSLFRATGGACRSHVTGHADPLLCLVGTGESNRAKINEIGIEGTSLPHPQVD